jgi:hypothetical protein
MLKAMVAAVMALGLAGCAGSLTANIEDEIVNSIRYDALSCEQLVGERNRLAAQFGLSRDTRRTPLTESQTTGAGPFLPDMRGPDERRRATAIGALDAMNRSLQRRNCVS